MPGKNSPEQLPGTDPADATGIADREIFATRLLDAPRDLVFSVWTDVSHLAQWWGPTGFRTTTRSADMKPGGAWRFVMHGPDGRDYENIITFLEIEKPARLVYKHGGGNEAEPINFQVEVHFDEEGSSTRLTMRMIFPSKNARDFVIETYGAFDGLKETMARLKDHITTLGGFTVTRTFDAPRDLVWRVNTEAGHLQRWWGPKGFAMKVAKLDMRPGGLFHYGMETPNGQKMWGRCVFRDVAPPERLAYVVSFSDENAGVTRAPFHPQWPLEVLTVVTFTEKDGKTTFTLRSWPVNATESERKAYTDGFKSLEGGFKGTLDQLDAYLETHQGR